MHLCASEQPWVRESDGQSGKQIHTPKSLRLIGNPDKCVCDVGVRLGKSNGRRMRPAWE